MLSLFEIKKILSPEVDYMLEDDFRIIQSWAEYDDSSDKNPDNQNLSYLCYELEVINPDTGEHIHFYKAIQFARVIRLPASAKQSLAFMDMHEQVLAGVHESDLNLITIIANVIKPVPQGLLFLYGIQGVSGDLDDAKRKCHDGFLALIGMMQATYRVLELRCAIAQETEWLREKMYNMDYMTMVRGIPKANRAGEDAGNRGLGGANLNPESQGTLEELITGMADYEYVIQVLSTPVYNDTLMGWQRQSQKEMTDWYGQLQGTKSLSMNLSIPMMYMANASQSQGWSKAYTDANTVSYAQGESFGTNENQSVGESLSQSFSRSVGQSESMSLSNGISRGVTHSNGVSFGESFGINEGQNAGMSAGASAGMSANQGMSMSEGVNTSESMGHSEGNSYNVSHGQNTSMSHSVGQNQSFGYNESESVNMSNSASHGQNASQSMNQGVNHSSGHGNNFGGSSNQNFSQGSSLNYGDNSSSNNGFNVSLPKLPFSSLGVGLNHSSGQGVSSGIGMNQSVGGGTGESWGTSFNESNGVSMGSGVSFGESNSISESIGYGQSHGFSQNFGASESYGISRGESLSEGFGINQSDNYSKSIGNSLSLGSNQSVGQNFGTNESMNVGQSTGQNYSQNAGRNESVSESETLSQTLGQTVGKSLTEGQSTGYGQNVSHSQGVSSGNSYTTSNGQSKGTSAGSTGTASLGTSSSMGLGPSIGYSKSYQWMDQGVKDLLELLDFQNERIKKALRGQGAFYTYVYIACPNRDALATAQAVAKSTWQNNYAMIQPLQVLDLTEREQKHLLYHFTAFSADVSKENVFGVEEYKYCTVLLPEEYVAYTHLPRISEGGVDSIIQDIPKFRVTSMLKGEIYMGTILNPERFSFKNGYRTPFDYRIEEESLMHAYFTGASRSGKTVAAMRFVAELSRVKRKTTGKRMRIVALDPKRDWRTLGRYIEPERFNFYSLGNLKFRPIKINPWKIPHGVQPQQWIDGVIDIYCRAYGLLERGKQMMADVVYELYEKHGVMAAADQEDWEELVPDLSRQVNFESIYMLMFQKKADLENPNNKGGRAGNDTRDAYARLLDRLSCFSRTYSIERQLFGTSDGIGIDELIGNDDVTVLESKGLENTFKNFVFGVITSGFYKFALAHEGGFLADDQYETVLVIEEANEVLIGTDTAGSGGGQQFGLSGQSEFEQILDQSAGYGLFIVAITQKIADMPSSIIANSGLVFAGKLKRPEDINVVVRAVGREERIDDRDLVKWFPKSPTGWFVCQSSRTFNFKEAEPYLVQISRLNINPPSNLELDEIMTRKEMFKQLGYCNAVS